MNILGHFKTITKHKVLVAKGCFRIGLYKQGLLHDMSKYSPVEFIPGARYYKGTESPNNTERKKFGISKAWLHHKGRNKHHFEYWLDYGLDRDKIGYVGMKIPKCYMGEMFVDRISAGKIYNGDAFKQTDPLDYFNKGIGATIMHAASREYLTLLLTMYAKRGEDATFAFLRRDLQEDISGYDKISPFDFSQEIHLTTGNVSSI